MAKRWFVLHTHSGFEHRVKAALEERIKTDGYDEAIDEIVLPLEEVTEIRKGKKQIAKKKFLPGYLFIHIETDEKSNIPNDTWHMIRNIPKVTAFVGHQPISPEGAEYLSIKRQYSLLLIACCNMPFVVKSKTFIFPPAEFIQVQSCCLCSSELFTSKLSQISATEKAAFVAWLYKL